MKCNGVKGKKGRKGEGKGGERSIDADESEAGGDNRTVIRHLVSSGNRNG